MSPLACTTPELVGKPIRKAVEDEIAPAKHTQSRTSALPLQQCLTPRDGKHFRSPLSALKRCGCCQLVISESAVIQTEPPNSPSRRSIRASAI